MVGYKEPGAGTHVEPIDNAARQYQFTEIVTPVNAYHGALSRRRMEQQAWRAVGRALDNCQHAARCARQCNGIVVEAGLTLFFVWLANWSLQLVRSELLHHQARNQVVPDVGLVDSGCSPIEGK